MYDIREARDKDRDSAIRLLWKAHSVTDPLDGVREEDWAKGWHRPEKRDWSFIAVYGDEVVANVSFFEDKANIIRGKSVPFSAVWGVATLPQHRRKGLIRKAFIESFKKMKELGLSLSILAPFYKTYYEKFGYALAEHRVRHEFPRTLLRLVKGDESITNREMTDPSEAKVAQEVQSSMSRFGSRNFHTISSLERMIKGNHFHVFGKGSKPVGIVKFHFTKVEEDHLDLSVSATAYTSDDVFPSIVELVGHYATNATTIRWYCDPQVPVRYYMDDLQNWNTVDWSGMMMRVVDFETYCSTISVPKSATESVTLKLDDDLCPWNAGTYLLSPSSGRLECIPLGKDEAPDISVDAFGLSEIIGGLTPPLILHSFGRLECSVDTARNLEAIFPEDSFVSYQRF